MNRQNNPDDSDELPSAAACLSRREFVGLAGTTAATLALAGDPLARAFATQAGSAFPRSRLSNTHDLVSLPAWGPYSKKHFGISHIPDLRQGLNFDLSLFPLSPGVPARLPSVTGRHSGVHPWEAAPQLEHYAFRFETIWKDLLYCDLSFSEVDSNRRLIRMELVNRTPAPQGLVLNCLAQMCFPPLHELTAQPIRLCAAELPPGAIWTGALDYVDLRFAKPRPTDDLVTDGMWRGEERHHDTVGGSVIAQRFGFDAGDHIHYRVHLERSFSNAVLVWRHLLNSGENVDFRMDGDVRGQVTFQGVGAFTTVAVPLGPLQPGALELHFTSAGGAAPALDGFAIVDAGQEHQIHFVPRSWHPVPRIHTAAHGDALILQYQDSPNAYGFLLDSGWVGQQHLPWKDLDQAFHCVSDPDTKARIFGDGSERPGDPDSLFLHAWSKPITLAPNSKRLLFGLVCTGTVEEVRTSLENFNPRAKSNQRIFLSARKRSYQPCSSPGASPFDLSQRLMASVTLTNLVYPLYTQGNYIRNYSPGKIWDCLYTWDAGFIGLGLLELDHRCALDALNAYTTPAGAQSAFIHHGTPLPVQIYLYYELWNRTQSREMLAYFYPRLRQYHLFMAGKLGSSTTRKHQDHLICTWDYFYNSGGWDDYPPQKYMHTQKMASTVAPAVNSSHTIRCAKLLRAAAAELGRTEDFAEYDADIAVLSSSLQEYSWDEDSGYYGYVLHDPAGKPTGILRTASGVNFNMGLDGVCPLIAGICSPQQTAQILHRLFSPQHMWTEAGITTVDQTAPYYSPNGYWNGNVWFAHQWFLWKTMLDLGRGDLAVRIAQTVLAVWNKVTNASYNCMEHFVPRSPFGEGWDQFSSLSSPALSCFAALYTPGRLTCGFDVWLKKCLFNPIHGQLRANLRCAGTPPDYSVLVCMPLASAYRVLWNNVPAQFTSVQDGLLCIQLPRDAEIGELAVSAV